MSRNMALRILNPVLALVLINQVFSGAFRESLPYKVFAVLHQGGAVILIIAVLLHVGLNGNWIKAQYLKKRVAGKA